jgi:hypothetical protein
MIKVEIDLCKNYFYTLHTSLLKETNVPFYHWDVSIKPKIVNDIGFE